MQAFVDWPVGRDEIRIQRVEQVDDVTDLVFGGFIVLFYATDFPK